MAQTHSDYFPGLDGIRAVAVSLVLLSHSTIYDEFTFLRPIGLVAGYTGVTVFFVLSGYLITAVLLREEERSGTISLRLFYLRRALRLFPALWLYLLAVGVLWCAGALPQHPWHSFAASLLYIRNLVGRGHETDHLWSLSIEEQFYMIWPIIFLLLARRDRARLAVALAGLGVVTAWRVYAAHYNLASVGTRYIRSDFRFDAPLVGCCLALAAHLAPQTICLLNGTTSRRNALAAAGLLTLGCWVGSRAQDVVYPGTEPTVVCFIAASLVISQTGTRGGGGGLMTIRPLVLLGQISYGIYLWQQLFLGPLTDGFGRVRAFPVGLVLTLVVAIASYRLLELPLLRLKNRRFQPPPRDILGLTNNTVSITNLNAR